jgi:acetyl esterase/lipase
MSRVHAGAPPFFVVHGDRDTLVPVAEARRFTEALRGAITAPVAYAEIPGAQHAFELFPSLRTTFVVHGVERFLAWLYSAYLVERGAAEGLQAEAG